MLVTLPYAACSLLAYVINVYVQKYTFLALLKSNLLNFILGLL